MQTNFKELLDNTNLKPSEILEYYAKEIDRCFKQFNVNYDFYILTYFDYTKGFYHNTLKETAVEEFLLYDSLVNMSRNMSNLIKEFLSLYNVIEDRYQITIYNLDKDKNISFRDLIRFIDLNVYNIGNFSNHYNKVQK